MAGRIAFLVCEHFAVEANCSLVQLGFDDAVVVTFPARCGRPLLSAEECAAIVAPLGDVSHVEVIGSCCLSGIDENSSPGQSFHVHRLNSCFEFIADFSLVNSYLKAGAYLASPGWLETWPGSMERQGMSREIAREVFAGTSSSVVLLDTGVTEQSASRLQLFAEFLDRPYEIDYVGLAAPKLLLAQVIMEWRLSTMENQYLGQVHDIRKELSTYAMSLDLMAGLAQSTEVEKTLNEFIGVFHMLFAPERVCYLSFRDEVLDKFIAIPHFSDQGELEVVKKAMVAFSQEGCRKKSPGGFMHAVTRRGKVCGVLMVDTVAFPQYLDSYENLTYYLGKIGEIAIGNAIKYEKLSKMEQQLRLANEKLHDVARTDALTKVANRRSYDEYIESEWKRALRGHFPLALILCDIDYFKAYNDHYGHEMGDNCLHRVAQALRSSGMRPGDLVARYGGEEFVVVLPNTPLESALSVADRIRKTVEMSQVPHAKSPISQYVTISLGVSGCLPSDAKCKNVAVLFNMADQALYSAKHKGRNCVVGYPSVDLSYK